MSQCESGLLLTIAPLTWDRYLLNHRTQMFILLGGRLVVVNSGTRFFSFTFPLEKDREQERGSVF